MSGSEGYVINRQTGNGEAEAIGEIKGGNTTQFVDTATSTTERNYYGFVDRKAGKEYTRNVIKIRS